jgi:hypothetical protein
VHIPRKAASLGAITRRQIRGADENIKLWWEQVQYLVSESGKARKRGRPPALRRLFHGGPVRSTNHYALSDCISPPRPQPSASCLVARAAGKPSCWPMGTQARSGVGAATPTLLATVKPSVFQKSTCNQLGPASVGLQRGLSRMHAASTSASAEVTQPTGSTLTEIATISILRSPGTAHTHTISLIAGAQSEHPARQHPLHPSFTLQTWERVPSLWVPTAQALLYVP